MLLTIMPRCPLLYKVHAEGNLMMKSILNLKVSYELEISKCELLLFIHKQ